MKKKRYSGEIWTANYFIDDLDRLDITIRGKHEIGRIFAPTWEMVMALKKANDPKTYIPRYIEKYNQMMDESYRKNREIWRYVIQMPRVVFTCYCGADKFCHRVLLANYFHKHFGSKYRGEIYRKRRK